MENDIQTEGKPARRPRGSYLGLCSQEAIELIQAFEGLRLKAYQCPAGLWTIGYGHTSSVSPGLVIPHALAVRLLYEDVAFFEKAVMRHVTVPLNQNQLSALVCFSFNVGMENFIPSTLLKLLNRGWYEQVPAQLMRWNKAKGRVLGGLSRRRAAEAALWNKPTSLVVFQGKKKG